MLAVASIAMNASGPFGRQATQRSPVVTPSFLSSVASLRTREPTSGHISAVNGAVSLM
jgi:hypothetical protein